MQSSWQLRIEVGSQGWLPCPVKGEGLRQHWARINTNLTMWDNWDDNETTIHWDGIPVQYFPGRSENSLRALAGRIQRTRTNFIHSTNRYEFHILAQNLASSLWSFIYHWRRWHNADEGARNTTDQSQQIDGFLGWFSAIVLEQSVGTETMWLIVLPESTMRCV